MSHKPHSIATDLGLLTLRLTVGGLMAGHGAQKLFGSFGGHGLQGTAGWLESIGLKPGRPWALLAGGSEFAGGLLTAAGLLYPIGPMTMYGPMAMAWAKVHAGKPIWAAAGGAELPLMNIAAATALSLTGPGRFSLDRALGVRASPLMVAAALVGMAAGIAAGMMAESESAKHDARSATLDGPAGGEPSGDPSPGVALNAPKAAAQDDLAGAPLDEREFEHSEMGAVAYGGLGHAMPPELPELAKEVGADPPGAFPAWGSTSGAANPRPDGDARGDEEHPMPRD